MFTCKTSNISSTVIADREFLHFCNWNLFIIGSLLPKPVRCVLFLEHLPSGIEQLICVCPAGFELFEFEPLLFDGLDEPELLLLLFEGFWRRFGTARAGLFLFEFEFEVEAVLFFLIQKYSIYLKNRLLLFLLSFLPVLLPAHLFLAFCLCRIFRWCQSGGSAIFFCYIRLALSSFKETSTFLVSSVSTSLKTNVLSFDHVNQSSHLTYRFL